MVSKDQVTEMT